MPTLSVPEMYRTPIRRLGLLGPADVEKLSAALGPERYLGDVAALRAAFSEALPEEADTDALTYALLSMSTVREGLGAGVEEFVEDLSRAEDLEIPEDERQTFAERVSLLLANPTIQAVARSLDVQTEQQRVFLESRILTDLRPVFTGDSETQLLGMLVVHSLKILYSEDGQTKSFYISLDQRDAEQLKGTLKRAEDKAQALKETLLASKITQLRPEEH